MREISLILLCLVNTLGPLQPSSPNPHPEVTRRCAGEEEPPRFSRGSVAPPG
jgi:hypothetical protein